MTSTRVVGSGAVVVEVDGSAEGLRVLDYACTEAIRGGAELVLVASRPVHDPHLAADSTRQPWPSAERTGEFLRIAVAHVAVAQRHAPPRLQRLHRFRCSAFSPA